MLNQTTVTILAKNAQKTLKNCLESVKDFDEVILLDNESTDETLQIAKEFKNVKIYQSPFIGFGALKNLAISYAKNDWIFSLDSDEILEDDLLQKLKTMQFKKGEYYSILRKNLYNGEWIKGCGWHPDWVKRIFHKDEICFNDALVHEGLVIKEEIKEVKISKGGIRHYSFGSISDLLDKLQRYSTLWAIQNQQKKSSPIQAIFRGFWTFLRNFFLKRGFLYGYKGFIISVCNALGAFFKYMKLYENSLKKPSISLIVTTYNQKERLSLVLDSVKNQKILPLEVLVADDGSKEDTKKLIEDYQQIFPVPLRHVWQEDCGYRLSKSRNEAIKHAKGEYLVIVDGDMILHPYFIQDHQKCAKKKCFVQGGRIILSQMITGKILKSTDYQGAFTQKEIKSWRIPIVSSIIFKYFSYQKKDIRKDSFLPIRGCNMAFFKEDILAINGFNEDFIGWGREDSEFAVRFLNAGGEIRKLKFGGVAYHLWHKENQRAMLDQNHQIYLESIETNKTYCQNGIKKDEKSFLDNI